MPAIYLLRHGQADYQPIRSRGWPGATADLAPLSELGQRQAGQAARQARQLAGTGQIRLVSSPVTRALQTAGILAGHLGLSLTVEFDLREWLPDSTFSWHTHAEVRASVDDFERHDGEWPAGQQLRWEPLSQVQARAAAALARSAAGLDQDAVLIAVCHEMVIRAITGEPTTATGQFRLAPPSP